MVHIINKYNLILNKNKYLHNLLTQLDIKTPVIKNPHKYHTIELDAMWRMDFTLINAEFYLLTIMDASTRKIMGWSVFMMTEGGRLLATDQEVINLVKDTCVAYKIRLSLELFAQIKVPSLVVSCLKVS